MSPRHALPILGLALLLPVAVSAGPPAHAPAHGHRQKQVPAHEQKHEDHGDVAWRIVVDSQRGIQVVVGFPGVYFHEDHYYRHADGGWQVSGRPDRGWTRHAGIVPLAIKRAQSQHPAKRRD